MGHLPVEFISCVAYFIQNSGLCQVSEKSVHSQGPQGEMVKVFFQQEHAWKHAKCINLSRQAKFLKDMDWCTAIFMMFYNISCEDLWELVDLLYE